MKTLIFLTLVLVAGSIQQASSIRAASAHPTHSPAVDTFFVDITSSKIKWKGTKFWGMGKHEGIIQLSAGELQFKKETIIGGWFEVDMHTIEVTDIPETDPIPRNRLRNHLMDEDFFAVESYPVSRFVITEATKTGNDEYIISGNLTMRGVTHPVNFNAEVQFSSDHALQASALLEVNRQNWGIAYRGSKLTNDLVDDEILLQVLLKCNTRD